MCVERFFISIFTELMYLSYARSMVNLCVVLYDCIFNWNTRTSRCDSQSEITAEKSKSCTFNAIFPIHSHLLGCVFFVHRKHEHPFRHLQFRSPVPAFWASENTNCLRITCSVLVCASLTIVLCVYLSISMVATFSSYVGALYFIHHCK